MGQYIKLILPSVPAPQVSPAGLLSVVPTATTMEQVWAVSRTHHKTGKLKVLGVFENRLDASDWMREYMINIFRKEAEEELLEEEDEEQVDESTFNDRLNEEINGSLRMIEPNLDLWVNADPIEYKKKAITKTIKRQRDFAFFWNPFTYRMSPSRLYKRSD